MATVKKKINFLESEEGIEVKQALQRMDGDSTFNTEPSYSANTVQHPDNLIPFVEKHLNYLTAHPAIDPGKYISNLRLMTRRR